MFNLKLLRNLSPFQLVKRLSWFLFSFIIVGAFLNQFIKNLDNLSKFGSGTMALWNAIVDSFRYVLNLVVNTTWIVVKDVFSYISRGSFGSLLLASLVIYFLSTIFYYPTSILFSTLNSYGWFGYNRFLVLAVTITISIVALALLSQYTQYNTISLPQINVPINSSISLG